MSDEANVDLGNILSSMGGDAPAETTDTNLLGDFVNELVSPTTSTEPETPAEETPATEEPVAEETPASEEGDDEPKLPEGASPKAAESWNKLRGSRDKYKAAEAELTKKLTKAEEDLKAYQAKAAELETVKGKAALLPEMEEKLKQLDELERLVSIHRLEDSKEYQTAIAKPLSVIGDTAKALARANESNPQDILDILAEPDMAKQRQMFKETTAGWDDMDRLDLRRMMDDSRDLLSRSQDMRQNASAAAKEYARLQAESAEKAKAASRAEFGKATENVVESLKSKVPFVPLREGETMEKHFASVAEKVRNIDFDSTSANNKAFAAASAILLPSAVKTIEALQKEVASLKARVSETNTAKPTIQPAESKQAESTDTDFLTALGVPKNPMMSQALNVKG